MDFEIVKIGENLHENIEGFRRAGHIYICYKYPCCYNTTMETGSDSKTSRLTGHYILSILQRYPKDPLSLIKVMEESIGTGR